jgi:hypothetical protein
MKSFLLSSGICVVLILFIALIINVVQKKYRYVSRLKSNQSYYDSTYLRKQGGTSTFGPNGFDNPIINYNLRSWDGGKNWYATEYNDDWGIKILGPVDSIYPGLLEHLNGWDILTNHVMKNGPINFTNADDVEIFEGAGFTIEKTKE